MRMFDKTTLDKLSERGRAGIYDVVETQLRPITEYVNVMVVKDTSTGKFFRGEFLNSSEEAIFTEVAVKPTVEYVPVDN